MKLYTEEQVLEIIANVNRDVHVGSQELLELILEGSDFTPIELPIDDEIEKESFYLYAIHHTYILNVLQYKAFNEGVKWMRNKIQGGEK